MRIAVDTGGTFTDCVFVHDGELRILKVPSTPENPARAIAEALRKVATATGIAGREAIELTCGTTVGTNALLQRRGGRVALVTTAGFEDVLEIGRQARPQLYNFFVERPTPLVPRERRFGLKERFGASGEVLARPNESELNRIVRLVRASRPDAVAVCLLFSFANPKHEKQIAQRLRAAGFQVSASHEVHPEFREYERTATTVVNACLLPVMSGHLEEVEWIAGEGARHHTTNKAPRVRVMQSNGGIISSATASREPVRTILSGPAGGVLGAQYVAELAGFARVITFDMGGTSTDVALLDGPLRTTNESEVAGLPVSVPMLEIHTVGAGGGSLARFDSGGALRVGPESAGADPGPICYGRGTLPTVTDAHVMLGRIGGSGLLGGEFQLDVARTREWMGRARGTMKTVEQFAQGILDVVETNMEKAIRVISVERGHDPRDYTLVAFGGAGGLHACALAAALDMPRVLVPTFPGGLSALGILRADVVKDFSKTLLLPLQSRRTAEEALKAASRPIDVRAEKDLQQEGFANAQIEIEHLLDMRYIGQAYELTVSAKGNFLSAFHQAHAKRYGYSDPARAAEIVNVRVRARGVTPKPNLPKIERAGNDARPALTGEREVFFGGRAMKTRVYQRERLRARNRITGPAIVFEYSATTVVLPHWVACVDAHGNLLLERTR